MLDRLLLRNDRRSPVRRVLKRIASFRLKFTQDAISCAIEIVFCVRLQY
jgi:hypothetical protein